MCRLDEAVGVDALDRRGCLELQVLHQEIALALHLRGVDEADALRARRVVPHRIKQKVERLAGGRWARPRFHHSFATEGWHWGYVEVDDLHYPLDNRRYFAVEVLDKVNLLAVNGAPSVVPRLDELFFLVNGDSLFDCNWLALAPAARDQRDWTARMTLAAGIKGSRYGRVEIDGDAVPEFIKLPVTANGRIFPREDIDLWEFDGEAGKTVTAFVHAQSLNSPLIPQVDILDTNGKVVAELTCDPALPFGIGDHTPPPSSMNLEPGDALLCYTDGVIEARTPTGEFFGLERLADLAEREAASGHPAEELVRRLVLAVTDHQASELRDDATLLLVQWTGISDPAGVENG